MKRFYESAGFRAEGAGFVLTLDGKPAKTPGRKALSLPTEALAEAVAGEWDAQADDIDPGAMPLTGFSNRGIDLDAGGAGVLRREAAGFAQTDLLRHRADGPREEALFAEQARLWDPWLAWAADALDLRLTPVSGLMPAGDPAMTARARAVLDGTPDFTLPALHRLTGVFGSFVLAQAVARDALDPDAAFAASRLEERHQERAWGEDAEAKAREAALRAEALVCARFLFLSRPV